MGAAIARNVAKQIISTSNNIATTYVQNCTGSGSQTFGVDISSGCQSKIGDINITNQQVINVKCVSNDTTISSMKADIQAQITQQATAAAQSIGGPSVSFSDSIATFSVEAANTITTLYTQTCIGQANESAGITCSGTGSTSSIGAINVTNTQNVYTDCVSTNNTNNSLTDALTTIIYNQTNAKEANTLGGFVGIGLIFLGVLGIGFVYTTNGPMGWIIVAAIAVIIVAVIVYAAVAFSQKLYPFNQQTSVN